MSPAQESQDILKAGTGFMLTLADAIRNLKERGYSENLIPCFDHFECQSGKYKMYPNDIKVDEIIRFENTSDPDDQAILYAISFAEKKLKGIYTDSFGLYHDDLSNEMVARLMDHPH